MEQEAETAVATLGNLLRPQGLNLRDEIPDPADLTKGMTAEWLGFTLVMEKGRMRVLAGEDAWEKLEDSLAHARRYRHDPERAVIEALSGWLEYASPAYRPGEACRDYRREFVLRTSQLLAGVGITTQRMPLRVIHATWKDAYRRWRRRRRRVMYRMDATLRGAPLAPPNGSKTASTVG